VRCRGQRLARTQRRAVHLDLQPTGAAIEGAKSEFIMRLDRHGEQAVHDLDAVDRLFTPDLRAAGRRIAHAR